LVLSRLSSMHILTKQRLGARKHTRLYIGKFAVINK
jgi:hypothetical protein